MSSPSDGEPVNLLALDGGGIRGVSELLILDEIMKRLQYDMGLPELPKPCDIFHLIGGTSTGGLIAIMLGRLRMSTTEALKKYNEIAGRIFSKRNMKWETQEGKFKAITLEQEIKKIVAAKTEGSDGETRMLDEAYAGKKGATFVCAMPANSIQFVRRFRTYMVRDYASPNCKIWEAARATTAAPTFFKRIAIGEPGQIKEQFIDAGIGCNNPADEVLNESRLIFGDDRPLGVLISLGTGEKLNPSLARSSVIQNMFPTKLAKVLAKIATDSEKVADEISRRLQHIPNHYFRFNTRHGMGEITLDEWKRMDEVQALTRSYLHESKVSDLVNEAVIQIRTSTKKSVRTVVTLASVCGIISPLPISCSSVPPTSFKRMPNASQNFTGQRVYLRALKDHFNLEDSQSLSPRIRKSFLLYGMGGSGKTQICLKFVEDNPDRFSEVFWIDASNNETIKQSFEDIAENSSAKAAGVGKSTESILQWLSRKDDEWLLIFDNADDGPKIVEKNIPPGNRGNLLITSRNRDTRRLVAPKSWKEVEKMEEEDAIDLLLRAAFLDEPSTGLRLMAKDIVTELCCLALAVDQAGAVIASGFCGVQDYLEIYRSRAKKLLDFPPFKGASNYDKAVFSTWGVSLQAIEEKSRSSDPREASAATNAILLLRVFAIFHQENIMEEIFRRCAEEPRFYEYSKEEDPNGELTMTTKYLPLPLLELDKDGRWDPCNFRDGIRMLLSFSLIKQDASGSIYSVHPLVHFWTREDMSKTTRLDHVHIATSILCSSVNGWKAESEDYTYRRKLIPHINAYRKHVMELGLVQAYFYDECFTYGRVFYEAGYWEEEEKLYVQAKETSLRVLGQEHLETMMNMHNLALTYNDQGRLKEAEELYVQVLETRQRVLGQEHPDTLMSMANLASTYWNQGHLKEAEELNMQAMEVRKEVLGQRHPETLTSMHNLACTWKSQGRDEDAIDLMKQAERMLREVLGPEHPLTMSSSRWLRIWQGDDDDDDEGKENTGNGEGEDEDWETESEEGEDGKGEEKGEDSNENQRIHPSCLDTLQLDD